MENLHLKNLTQEQILNSPILKNFLKNNFKKLE